MRQTKGALLLLLGVAPLLVAQDHHRLTVNAGDAAHQGPVVAVAAIAAQLEEVVTDQLDIVGGVWAVAVAGDLHFLPGGEGTVDGARLLLRLALQLLDLPALLELLLVAALLQQPCQLLVEVGERTLEIEIVRHEGYLHWAP